MIEKTITSMIGCEKLNRLVIHTDTKVGAEYGLMSHVSTVDAELSVYETQIAANFQFTSICVYDDKIFIGDEFGVIHTKIGTKNSHEDINTLKQIYGDDIQIEFHSGTWESEFVRSHALISISISKHGLLACFSDNQVWMKKDGKWLFQFTSKEPIRVANQNANGAALVASDNGLYLFCKDKWEKLESVDYELPRIIYTAIWFDSNDPLTFYVTSRNGFVLKGNVNDKTIVDADLPIMKYFDIAQDQDSFYLAAESNGVQRWSHNVFERIISDQTYRLAAFSDCIFVSTEEENLKPTIKSYDSLNGDLIKQVTIG